MKLLLLSACIMFLFSCGSDDFDEQSKLGSLRVLAISADSPEMNINSAATVTLTPLISYVDGGNTTLDISWEACPDPGIDFGADINCDSSPAALKLSGAATFNTSGLVASYYTGNAPDISLVIPAAAFAYLSTLDSDIQFNGLDYLCIITITDQADGNPIESLKRVKLSSKADADLNVNPSFTTIQTNNTNLTSYPTGKVNISISNPSNSESFDRQTNIGLKSFDEDMFISWYSSTGKFQFNRTDIGEDNEFKPSGSTGVFVAIYRDGRGGVASEVIVF
jgi:hypothetical protein